MRHINLFLVSVVVCLPGFGTARGDVGDKVIEGFTALANFTIECRRTTKHDPDPDVLAAVPAERRAKLVQPVARVERAKERIAFVDGRMMYSREADATELAEQAKAGVVDISKEVVVIGPDRGEELVTHHQAKRSQGTIQQQEEMPFMCFVDVALGRRLMNSQTFLTAQDFKGMHCDEEAGGDVRFTWRDASHVEHVMRYAKVYGFALQSYRAVYPGKDAFDEIICSDFRLVDGKVYMPYSIQKVMSYHDSKGNIRRPFVSEVKVDSIRLGENRAEEMRIRWPQGTPVLDRRTGLLVKVKKDGEVLTERRLFEYLKEREDAESADTNAAGERINRLATRPVDTN